MKSDKGKGVIICRCEEITGEEIREAISRGARTITEIKKITRAGMGICQGRFCSKSIARILSRMTGKKLGEIELDTPRPPVRPVKLVDLVRGDSEYEC